LIGAHAFLLPKESITIQDMASKKDFVKAQLAKVPGIEWGEKEAKIRCPFHDDHNPSLGVSLVNVPGKVSVGGFNCWSCPEGHGGWNKLAERLNALYHLDLKLWDPKVNENDPDNHFIGLSEDLDQLSKLLFKKTYVKPATEGPWEGPWRGFTGSFLRSVGAEIIWDKEYEEYRIWLPVYDLKQNLIGDIKARGDNSDIPAKAKYKNSYDFPSKRTWYCLNFEKNPKTLVICEGPVDALRLRSHGIPAISCLGTKTLTEMKIMQLLAVGCRKIILALDGDAAGREFTPKFYAEFKRFGFEVVDLNLSRYIQPGQDKIDPGDAPLEVIQDLKAYLELPVTQPRP
jgi:DNA primase